MPTSGTMKLLVLSAVALLWAEAITIPAVAQTPAPRPIPDGSTAAQLLALTKKIEEQNAKIDTLSQQILKLEQQMASARPGVMIGEATPASAAAPESSNHVPPSGNTHIVARGETLTSIAKMHNMTVGDLQKMNHIENDRKLQIGQTILIPGPATSTSSTSPND